MKIRFVLIPAAALAFGCASSTPETRTASNSPATWGAGATTAPNTAGDVHHTAPVGTSGQSTTDNNTGIRTVTGPVAAVGQDSIQLAMPTGSLQLKIDPGTQVFHAGQPLAEGLSAIREGQQVRASYDVTQNHVSQIELLSGPGVPQGGTRPRAQPDKPASDVNNTPNQQQPYSPR